MQTLDQNLTDLVRRNIISPAEARGKAKFPENFPGRWTTPRFARPSGGTPSGQRTVSTVSLEEQRALRPLPN